MTLLYRTVGETSRIVPITISALRPHHSHRVVVRHNSDEHTLELQLTGSMTEAFILASERFYTLPMSSIRQIDPSSRLSLHITHLPSEPEAL